MGCWNGTDLITQLPILDEEPVKGFLLISNAYTKDLGGGGHCYSNDLQQPLSLPISGVYNDYGCIKNIKENYTTSLIVEYFKNNGNFEKLKAKEYPHHPYKEDFNIHDLVHWIERGDLVYVDNQAIGLVLVLEDIYNKIVNFQSHSNDILGFEPRVTVKNYYKNLINDYFSIFEKSLNDTELITSFMQMRHKLDFFPSIKYDKAVSCDEYIQLKEELVEFGIFTHFMNLTRKHWIIQSGAGGQSMEYKNYIALAETVIEHCNKKLKEFSDRLF
jgi:hypothetical protein